MNLSLRLEGEEIVRERIQQMDRRAENLSPVLSGKIADEFYDWMKRVFATEGGANPSGPWPPLSPEYAEWKLRNYPGAKLLHRTGHLEAILTGQTDESSEQAVGNTLRLDFDSEVARYHQEGTSRMPARRLFDLPPDMIHRMEATLMDYVMTGDAE